MKRERMGAGKVVGGVWGAVLAPATAVLPALAARLGGQGGWLAPLAALPALLLIIKVWGALARETWSGPLWAGRLLTFIYIMWALLLAGARLRLSGQRLRFTAQREVSLWFFLPVLAGMAAWLVWSKGDAFVRAASVFGRVLTLALLVVLGLTVVQVQPEHLLPLWTGDLLPILRASVPALGVLCYGMYGGLLWNGEGNAGVKRRVSGGCLLLALLVLCVLGNLGPQLAGALEDPFLTLSRRVGVEGAFQRVESLVSALWLLGDLALAGLLLWACRRLAERLAPRWKGERTVLAGAAVILLAAGTVFRDAALAQWFEYTVAPLGNLVLGVGVPCVLYGACGRKGTSCA